MLMLPHYPWLGSFRLAWGLGGKLVLDERKAKTYFEFLLFLSASELRFRAATYLQTAAQIKISATDD